MKKRTAVLLRARANAPGSIRGHDFDVWFLPIILEGLEPMQREVLEWMLIGIADDPAMSTPDICECVGSTPERIGAAISRLRDLGLLITEYRKDGGRRTAYHTVAEWVRSARRRRL